MKKLRPLSHGELFLQVPTVGVCSELGLSIDITTLTQAFEDIVNQHPLLSATINTSADNQICFFENRWKGEIEEITLTKDQSIENFLNFVANFKLDNSECLLKVWYVLENDKQYIVIAISHSVTDGRCGTEFLLLGLKRYEELISNDAVVSLERRHLPDSIESRLPMGEKLIEDYVDDLKKQIRTHNYRHLNISNTSPTTLHHKFHCFSKHETNSILSSCKSFGLTFNNVFESAALLSVHELINNQEPQERSHYLYRTLIDLRNRITPPIPLDCFITAPSSVLTSAQIEENANLINLAKQIAQKSKKEKHDVANANLHQAQKVLLRTQFIPQALHLSNVGKIEIPKHLSHTKPQNMLMMVGNMPFKTIVINTCTFNNRITFDMFYVANYYPKDLMTRFFDQMITLIQSIQGD